MLNLKHLVSNDIFLHFNTRLFYFFIFCFVYDKGGLILHITNKAGLGILFKIKFAVPIMLKAKQFNANIR